MKTLISAIVATILTLNVFAQVPTAFNYQAVARNNSGVALANQTMQVRLSVLQGSTSLYSETRTVTTNLLGLFNVQIGSVGASSTTGSIGAIDWGNSTVGWYSLKVELDLSNINVFTDMGTQALTSVPFSLASEKANSASMLSGFPVDTLTTPTIDARLAWNGNTWTPIKNDTLIVKSGSILVIPSSTLAPWVFASSSTTYADIAQITVTGNETIVANFTASIYNNQAQAIPIQVAMCYQNMSGGTITPFNSNFHSTYIPIASLTNRSTIFPAAGAIKLPAGTYRIGIGIKNLSTTLNIGPNDTYNGTIEVRY